jgi:hypothetical protein
MKSFQQVVDILKRKGFKEECPNKYYWTFINPKFWVIVSTLHGVSSGKRG